MKKIIALIMAVSMAAVTLVSCGKYDDGEKFVKGEAAGGKYVNESIGIGFDIPDEFMSVEGLPSVAGVTYDASLEDENGNSVFVVVETNAKKKKIDAVAKDAMTKLAEQYEKMGYTIEDSKIEDVTVDNKTFKGFSLKLVNGEDSVTQAGFFVKCDTKIATVNVTGKTVDAKTFIKDNFFAA